MRGSQLSYLFLPCHLVAARDPCLVHVTHIYLVNEKPTSRGSQHLSFSVRHAHVVSIGSPLHGVATWEPFAQCASRTSRSFNRKPTIRGSQLSHLFLFCQLVAVPDPRLVHVMHVYLVNEKPTSRGSQHLSLNARHAYIVSIESPPHVVASSPLFLEQHLVNLPSSQWKSLFSASVGPSEFPKYQNPAELFSCGG